MPNSTYEAKKLFCPLGMEYDTIHVCQNDCVLYRNEYQDLREYPRCGKSRYQVKENNDEGMSKKETPTKVLWYLPIIPRFRRLFSEENNAKLLRWHADERKKDGMLRHPVDSPQ